MNKKILFLLLFGLLVLPLVTFAAVDKGDVSTQGDFGRYEETYSLTGILEFILNALWIIFTAIAVIMFVIAGILFLTAGGAPDKLTQARSALIWGTVGIVVAIIAFSIITIVSDTLTTPAATFLQNSSTLSQIT
jgi:hypothetical protein